MGDSEDADKKNKTDKSGLPRKRYEIPKTATCHVCGDKAAEHLHYGGIACYSCRAFFRRTVNNTRPVLDCSNSNNCKINKDTRKRCQACRFQKCKDIGMKPSWVLSELEKSRLQDCGRRTNKTPDSVLVKKEEDIEEDVVPHVKDERAPSQGGASGGGDLEFSRGEFREEDRAGPSHSGGSDEKNLHKSERKSPLSRIKIENPSTPTLDNPSHPHQHLDTPSNPPSHKSRSISNPNSSGWGGSDRQQSPASGNGQWDRQNMTSQWNSRPSSSNSLPQQKQRPQNSSMAAEQQWQEFSRQPGAEMPAGSSEYDGRNNMQNDSLFPFNKMQVSLSAPGRDGLSFTIETHQNNDAGWQPTQQRQMGPSAHLNINQNQNYRESPSSLFPGYNNDQNIQNQQNKFSGASSIPGHSGPPGQAGRQGQAPLQGSSQQQQQSTGSQPSSYPNDLFRGSALPGSNLLSGQSSSEKSFTSSQEDLFEEYMRGSGVGGVRVLGEVGGVGGGATANSRESVQLQSVISKAQLPTCREEGGPGSSREILPDWEGCGGPAKRIKTEEPEEHRSILQMIDAVSSHRGTHSPYISPPHLNPLQSPPHLNSLQSPSHSHPLQSSPIPHHPHQSSRDSSLCGDGAGGYESQPLFSPDGGAASSPGGASSSSLVVASPRFAPVHVVTTPSHVALNQSLDEFNFQDISSDQDPQSKENKKKSSQIWKFGQFPMSSPMDYIQETIFLEQLASIDENLKSQVPMDEEHCRAFMLSALTGNKLRQYTILHAYQILIKRIVRLSNSIQDFIELPPGDMHKLLVANTVSMINVRISRWFHPKTSLEKQLSLCSAGVDLYKEVVLQQDLDPQFVERPIQCEDVFISPWCCDYNFEDRYFFLLKKMAQLPLDSTPLILLSVMMLFNSERVSGLDQIKLIVTHERKFSFLLFRYLQNTYTEEQAQKYFQMFFESKNYLMEMADILINKRLIC